MFTELAERLLNKSVLEVNGYSLRITEIEVYLYSKDHPDEYTHRHPLQQKSETIYFHRSGSKLTSKYRGGTFKGMDLIFSNGEEFFGVLIRSICHGENFVTGPCCVVNYLLKLCEKDSIEDLVSLDKLLSFNDGIICLKNSELSRETIYYGPRVGLSEKYPQWKEKMYRYAILIKGIKKDKKKLQIMQP